MRKLLLGLIGLLFAVPAVATDLPAGYTELEYIESTGTQYIDTGIKQQDGDEFGLVYQQITLDASYRNLFGAAVSGRASEFYISQTSSVTYVGNTSNDGIPRNTNKHTLSWVTTSSSSQNVVVDGQTYVVSVRITPNPNLNVMVFARNASNGKMIGKVYGYYQKRNGEYLINLVPAKNSSGVVGMYDTVSGNFFTNAGTGEFIASPEFSIRIATTAYNAARFSPVVTELNTTIATIRDVVTNTINQTKAIADLQATKQTRPNENCPAGKKCLLVEDDAGQPHWYEIIENAYGLPNGYTALEYIESTGTQYIDTGIKPIPNVTSVELNVAIQDIDTIGQVFGSRAQSSASSSSYNIIYSVASGKKFRLDWVGTSNAITPVVTQGKYYNIKLEPDGGVYLDGTYYPKATNKTECDYNMYLFALNTAGNIQPQGSMRIKGPVQIKNDGVLVRDFVPAKNSSGVVGVYDTVSGTFFTNAGTGTFVAGPEI